MSGKVTGMILDGQTIEFILYLCSDKVAFYNIMDEALALIEKSEKAQEKPVDHNDIKLNVNKNWSNTE